MINRLLLMTLAISLCAVGCKPRPKDNTAKKTTKSDTVKTNADAATLELYVMSKCPFGVKALDALIPAAEKLGSALDLKVDYIGQKKPDGSFDSMHGAEEVEGDILHLCANAVAKEKHFPFISCMNKDWRSAPKNWEACAKEVGLDIESMKKCKEGDEGKNLLAESFERSMKAGAQGSPTIKLNGEAYRGGRKTNDFLRGICDTFKEKKPEACSNIPKPPKVTVIALTDKRCKECDVEKVLGSLKEVFPGLEPKTLDWSSDEAKQVAKDAEIKLLPAILFDDSIKKDEEGASHMSRYLQPAGKYQTLRIGAEFDPTAEICDNGKDDTGNGKVDCDDDSCKSTLLCREEKKNTLEVFVMSQCPYGVMGLDAMKDVLKAFGDDLTFAVHYIADETPDGKFNSLHGQPEVEENLRELCVAQHYRDNNKYMDYIWCRNQNIRSTEWKSCTGDNGIDTAVIEKCSTGDEGKKLLSEDLKLAKELKIGGSPTWLINNRTTFNAISAPDIQKQICEKNADLKGCKAEIKVDDNKPAPPAGSCGG